MLKLYLESRVEKWHKTDEESGPGKGREGKKTEINKWKGKDNIHAHVLTLPLIPREFWSTFSPPKSPGSTPRPLTQLFQCRVLPPISAPAAIIIKASSPSLC